MKKNLFFSLLSLFAFAGAKAQISSARSAALGTTVTVKGIVTNGSELGSIRYIQDASGAICAYGSTLSTVTKGDSVTITGPTKLFKNLLEIDPVVGFTVHASKPLPTPLTITPSAIDESKEAQLIKILNCTFMASGTFTTNTNYTVTAGGQNFELRVSSPAPSIVGTPIPTGSVNITGLLSQFCNTPTVGCTSGYQIIIRDLNDIVSAGAPTGISERNKNSNFIVFPNPTTNKINFTIGSGENVLSVIVTDIFGRTVFASSENNTSFETNDLADGMYNLIIYSDKQEYYSRFTVVK